MRNISKVFLSLSKTETKNTNNYLTNAKNNTLKTTIKCSVIGTSIENNLWTQLQIFKEFKWKRKNFKPRLRIKRRLTKRCNFFSRISKKKLNRTTIESERSLIHKSSLQQRTKNSNNKKQNWTKSLKDTSLKENLELIRNYSEKLSKTISAILNKRKCYFQPQFN